MTPDLLDVKLEKLVYGGDALGRLPDGRAVFVPYGLPGELVRLRLVEERRDHARAELVEVLQPAAGRQAPRCRHFGTCGGCHYQHMSYAGQLSAKTDILRDQLERIGRIVAPPLKPIVPSPQEWGYRNHVQFHLAKDGKLGFRAPHSRAVVPIVECHLPEAPLAELWPKLDLEPGMGLERIALRLGVDGQTQLVLESRLPQPPELDLEADLSVVHLFEGDAVVLAGEEVLEIAVEAGARRRVFRVSAASFFQVNTAMAGQMVAYLLEVLPLTPASTVLDVYCGVGLFSAFLAGQVGRLVGIEASPAACRDFAANLDEFENVELYEAPAEQALPALDLHPDLILVDPPRAGLERGVVEALLALGPETLAYVSCDPSTLARDAARLTTGGYALVEITPFDLFPQTSSIESISLFRRA